MTRRSLVKRSPTKCVSVIEVQQEPSHLQSVGRKVSKIRKKE